MKDNNNYYETNIIDCHSHFLPKMDDGSKSIDESIEMLLLTKKQGINSVCSTSHFYPNNETPESFKERRKLSIDSLLKEIESRKIENLPDIYIGAEAYYFDGIGSSKRIKECMIEGTHYLLLEMPFSEWSKIEYDEVILLMENFGITPIIAHINRYINYGNNLKYIKKLQKEGCLLQLNSEFFIDKKTERKAIRFVKKGLVDLIGSDMHNTTSRPQTLSLTIKIIMEKCGPLYINKLENNANMVFKNARKVSSTN